MKNPVGSKKADIGLIRIGMAHLWESHILETGSAQSWAIKGHHWKPSQTHKLPSHMFIAFAMNPSFKFMPAPAQFDIIHYTAPPVAKPRRPQASQRRKATTERYSLPDLTPNSLFDQLDGIQDQSTNSDLPHTASVDRASEMLSTPETAMPVVDLNSAGSVHLSGGCVMTPRLID